MPGVIRTTSSVFPPPWKPAATAQPLPAFRSAAGKEPLMKIYTLLALLAAPALAHPAAKGKTEVTWYGHAAFVVKTPGGTALAIHPWITNPANPDKTAMEKIAKLDYTLISHGHFDHLGDAVALQKKTRAKIVASFALGANLVSAG